MERVQGHAEDSPAGRCNLHLAAKADEAEQAEARGGEGGDGVEGDGGDEVCWPVARRRYLPRGEDCRQAKVPVGLGEVNEGVKVEGGAKSEWGVSKRPVWY
jgi:hypothetical protein